MSGVIRLKVPTEMQYTVIPTGTSSKVNLSGPVYCIINTVNVQDVG